MQTPSTEPNLSTQQQTPEDGAEPGAQGGEITQRVVDIKKPQKKEPLQLDERGVVISRTSDDEFRLAQNLMSSGVVNGSLRNPVQVMVAMQALRSVGLNVYTALRQVAFVDGNLTFFGELELAIVRMSGLLQSKEEYLYCVDEDGKYQRRCFDNSNLHLPVRGAVCRMLRRHETIWDMASFSVEDAIQAKLWGNPRKSTWMQFPQRMLQMRARGQCLRNAFPDVLQGMHGEYAEDYVKDEAQR